MKILQLFLKLITSALSQLNRWVSLLRKQESSSSKVWIPHQVRNDNPSNKERQSTSFLLLLLLCCLPLQAEEFLLDRNTVILVDGTELYPIQRAVLNLAEDIKEATDSEPVILDPNSSIPWNYGILVTSSKEVLQKLAGWQPQWEEAYIIKTIIVDGRKEILIGGGDILGTIYGIYHFSEQVLDTDPFKFWTEYRPPSRRSITIQSLDIKSNQPTFRYRGFFINDEDLLTGWKKGSPYIEPEIWEKVFETILRLKGNMVIAGTWLPAEERPLNLASSMGLWLAMHHAMPLGIGVVDWPETEKYSLVGNHEKVIDYWKQAILSYRGRKVIWTLGYRGLGDYAFWHHEGMKLTDQERAKFIQEAIETQYQMVREYSGESNPVMCAYLWGEGVKFYRNRWLKIPGDVLVVWSDNCDGIMEGLPRTPAEGKHGVYYHVAMHSGFHSQLAQTVPPERIEKEFTRIVQKEATGYMMLNVSDIREQVLGIRAVMDLSWQASNWIDHKTNYSESFYYQWCTKYFGSEHSDSVKRIYKKFFTTPFRWGKNEWETAMIGGCHVIATLLINHVLREVPSEEFSKRWTRWLGRKNFVETRRYVEEKTQSVRSVWEELDREATELANKLTGQAKCFYTDNLLVQIRLSRFSNEALYHISLACEQYEKREYSAAMEHLKDAEIAIESALEAEKLAEWGKWENWYRGDTFVDIPLTLKFIKALEAHCEWKLVRGSDVGVWKRWMRTKHR